MRHFLALLIATLPSLPSAQPAPTIADYIKVASTSMIMPPLKRCAKTFPSRSSEFLSEIDKISALVDGALAVISATKARELSASIPKLMMESAGIVGVMSSGFDSETPKLENCEKLLAEKLSSTEPKEIEAILEEMIPAAMESKAEFEAMFKRISN